MSVSHMISAFPAVREPVLNVQRISKRYGQQQVLAQVSFSVKPGEIFGLLGPNGAGKSTLMKVICGLSRPDEGRLYIGGRDAVADRQSIKAVVGVVPQENNLERELTIEEALLVYGRLFQVKEPAAQVKRLLQEFGLWQWRDKKIQHLSGGMARRALIARTLLPRPDILLLDEPSVGLDPDVRREIWNIITNLTAQGKTILMSTHYMEEAEQLCSRIALLKDGRILLIDTPENIKIRAGLTPDSCFTLENAYLQLLSEESV